MSELVTIKQFANEQNKTVQAVNQQIKRKTNARALNGHIIIKTINNRSVRCLDEQAVDILKHGAENTPSVIISTEKDNRILELEQENKNLLIKVAEQADKIAQQVQELRQNDKLLIETKELKELNSTNQTEIESLKKQIKQQQEKEQSLQQKLEQEQNRKLTFKERLRGRKQKI